MQEELAFLRSLPFNWLFQLLISALCGSIVGLEREWKRKAAGLRTNAMICMGSCLYVLSAELLLLKYPGFHAGDPTRMAGQIVVGMGFIGAGAIIQARGQIVGLTSAAAMWVVAAVGVVIGIGFPLVGLIVTLLVVGILAIVGKLSQYLLGKCTHHSVRLSFKDHVETWQEIERVCQDHSKSLDQFSVSRRKIHDDPVCFMEISYCDVHPEHREFLFDLLKVDDIRQAPRRG